MSNNRPTHTTGGGQRREALLHLDRSGIPALGHRSRNDVLRENRGSLGTQIEGKAF